jgi:dethiobiotin synthetase
MGRRLMIAGAGADTAAATAACAIAFAMAARGVRVGVMTPVETGCTGDALEPAGARALAYAASCALPIDLICPYRYRNALPPPLAVEAEGAAPPSLHAILAALEKITAVSDAVIVDASGGVALSLDRDSDYAELAAAAGLEVVLVAANDRSRIEQALSALRLVNARGLRLAGVILADIASGADTDDSAVAELVVAAGPGYLGRVRFREPLKLEIIARLL